MQFKKAIFSCLFLLLGVFLFPNAGLAIGVAPVIFDEINLDPGKTQTINFKVLNDSDVEKIYYFYTQNFTASDNESGEPKFLEKGEAAETADLASWIKVVQGQVSVKPRGDGDVTAIIQVPVNAEPGGHYAVIWATESNPESGDSVSIRSNTGPLVMVNVSGDVKEAAEVKEFNYLKKLQTRLPVDFYARIQNQGSVYFKPKGDVVIKSIFGRTVAKIDANPKKSNILPNSIRRIEGMQWIKSKDMAEGGFWTQTKNEWKNFAIGPYKATMLVTYGSGGQTVTATTNYFWVIPWHVIIVALVLLIILIIILKTYNKAIVRRANN